MKKKPANLLYTVCPDDPGGHRFTVSLDITTPDPDGQILRLPAWIPGSYLVRDFARQIETLNASSRGKPVPVRKIDNHSWQCAPCSGPLHIACTVYAWDLSVRSAHLDETHAFFNGTSLFLCPDGLSDLPCLLELLPPPHTDQWKVYTSLPEARLPRKKAAPRHGFGMYMAPDYDALIDHPVEMGTPQAVSFLAHGATHELVFTGVIPNLDLERIAADVQKICEAQIAFFEPETLQAPFLDSSNRYVFMTLVTDDGYGGLEHRASTALMAARSHLPVRGQPNAPEGYTQFLGLVSHEYFHTWNVKRIKPAAFAPYDFFRENHTQLLWIFEGFTSYYDDLFLLRAGLITRDTYLKLLGKVISTVHLGAGRHKQSVAESSFDAWTRYYKQDENSPNALVSYYTKGSLVALGLDLLLRSSTNDAHSLDTVMRFLWNRYGRSFYPDGHNGLPEDAFCALVREATGVDVTEFVNRHAYGCDDVPLDTLLAHVGVSVHWDTPSALPSLGLKLRMQHGQTQIATVYDNGPAHKAGLSAGDTLVALQGLRVTDMASMDRLLGAFKPNDDVVVHVFRRDELRAFQVNLEAPAPTRCTLKPIADHEPRADHQGARS